MSLAMAFGISDLDVQIAMIHLLHMSEAEASDERALALLDVINADSVADSALAGNSMEEQTQFAHFDIASQLLEYLSEEGVLAVLKGQWARVGNSNGLSFEVMAEQIYPDLDKEALIKAVQDCEPGQFTPTLHARIDAQLVARGVLEPMRSGEDDTANGACDA